MHKGGGSPQTGARAMVDTLTLDPNSLTDGDLTTLTLAPNEQLITPDLDSLVLQAELDRYTTTEVDMGGGGDTLCVTIPSTENIDVHAMEIGDPKEIVIPECETQLVEYTEDVDMNEVDITTSAVEEISAPVMMDTLQGHKIIHVQPAQQQITHSSPIIVSGASNTGQPSQSYVVIQSAPGSRVVTTNAANQAKKTGQIVGRIAGLNVGSSPQFQTVTQALTTARTSAGTVVQLRPIANSTPLQRPLAAKGQTITVSNVGPRMIQPQTSTPSRVTKVLLPRQTAGAGGSVQHLVAVPVQKSGQENQQEQVVTVGHQTLRIVSGNVVSQSQEQRTQKKIGEAVESIALSSATGQQAMKPKETMQVLQASQLAGKPVQLARTINPSQGNQVVNITVQQAQQMGLLSPGKLQQLMPNVQGRGIVVNKSATGGAVTVLQSNVVKSPTKILPAPAGGAVAGNVTLATSMSPSIRPLSLSPSKVIITRQAPVKQGSLLTTPSGQVIRLPASASTVSTSTSSPGVQPINVSGRTMQYVRLVSIPSSSNTTATLTTAPRPKATSVLTLSSPGAQGQIKMIPIAPAAGPRPVLPKSLLARTVTTSVASSQASASPVGTTTTQIADRGMSNIVVLPPNFLQQIRPQAAQIQQQQQPQQPQQQQIIQIKQEHHQAAQQQLLQIKQEQHRTITAEELLQLKTDDDSDQEEDHDHEHDMELPFYDEDDSIQAQLLGKSPPLLSAKLMTDAILTPASPIKPSSMRTPAEPNGIRPRKPCNCTKSQCLKMYCDCFANGEFCHMCNCNCCSNNLEHEEDRQRAIKAVLERNPHAFRPKIGKGQVGDGRRHNKGCNCRRSGCLKNYCECYEAKIACSNNCKCIGCRNVEDMGDAAARDFRELTNPGDLRLNPIAAISKKRSYAPLTDPGLRPLQDSTVNGFRQAFNFVTQDVVDATCHCLLAQAEKAEKTGVSDEVAEKLIIEEFGRCLVEIIGCANRTDDMVT